MIDSNDEMTIHLDMDVLPSNPGVDLDKRHAPKRNLKVPLSNKEIRLALANIFRYIPAKHHETLIPEFLEELKTYGRIYALRFRPVGRIKGGSINDYRGTMTGKAIQVMINNNLDFETALYPYELVTYGESGQVCQNWLQYRLIMKYLENLGDDQTLVVSSGHPVGLFPSHAFAPRVIATNGLMVGQWDNKDDFNRLAALGVTNYGQMTAGGWMYIGSQGIVHGTFITVLNAGKKYLGIPDDKDLRGVCFVSSGLGGMSGAQPKAVKMAGGVAVIAEVDKGRIDEIEKKGWVDKVSDSLSQIEAWIGYYKKKKEPISIAYHGNIVDLLWHIDEKDVPVELISDQTSCHVVHEGGYTPVSLTYEKGREMLNSGKGKEFAKLVDESLEKHFKVIKRLTDKGSFFWDYGNTFMASVFEADVTEIAKNGKDISEGFIWPSYVQDIMGPLCFDKGFGPFRWVCLSGKKEDLKITDKIAMECIDPSLGDMYRDNYRWIKEAGSNDLVMGTQARILYSDEEGRIAIALRFNEAVRQGEIGPIMMGRDHHDASGTDSPYRETSDIKDGSRTTADMSIQCALGNAARGMTMVVLSNGGGVGVSRASNGGYGILLNGSHHADEVVTMGLSWDVMGGVARRAWARNLNAIETAEKWNVKHPVQQITLPYLVDEALLKKYVQ